jgi:hypothetical protein
VIILQYRDAWSSRQRAECVTHDGKAVLIEVREDADHQIGAIDLLDLFLRFLRDGFDFHCSDL